MQNLNEYPDTDNTIPGESPIQQLARIRGWSVRAMQALGCTTENGLVVFPMKNATQKIVGYKKRQANNKPFTFEDGSEPIKSFTGKGQKSGLIYPLLFDETDPVLICEGEADTVAALSAGHPVAVGTAGAGIGAIGKTAIQTLLAGRSVILSPHPDEAGKRWLNSLGKLLSYSQCEVKYIPCHEKYDLDELLRFKISTLPDFLNSAVPWIEKQSGLPEINISNRHLREISDEALQALYRANFIPSIFQRSGQLVQIAIDEKKRPFITDISEHAMTGKLARAADFTTYSAKGNPNPVNPPKPVTQDILSSRKWDFPPLKNITEVPIIHSDGSIHLDPGYDDISNLYYHSTLDTINVPDIPTPEHVEDAVFNLTDIIHDFPFDSTASYHNAIAAILLPFIRPLINGPTPIVIIDKPQAGTGASLLIEIISLAVTGREPGMVAAPKDEDSWTKKITSLLKEGSNIIVFDNVENKLFTSSLALVITATNFKDRILKTQDIIELPNRACWFVTGNNIRLGGDLPRRCFKISINAKCARPWQRDPANFRHPDLKKWTLLNRPQIVNSALTLIRFWIQKGCPPPVNLQPLGSFEEWQNITGGILQLLKFDDFMKNTDEIYSDSDEDTPQWAAFFAAWFDIWGNAKIKITEIVKKLNEDTELWETLPDMIFTASDKENKGLGRRLGNLMSKKKNVVFPNDFKLLCHRNSSKPAFWQVEKV